MIECLAIMQAARFGVMIAMLETNRHLELRDLGSNEGSGWSRSKQHDIVPRHVRRRRTNFLVCESLPVWTQTAELAFKAPMMNGYTEPSAISAQFGSKRTTRGVIREGEASAT
jgi:hypothetical protein